MRGSPLIRLVLTFLLLVFLGAGMWKMTSRRTRIPHNKTSEAKSVLSSTVNIILTSSAPWEKCTMRFLDRTLVIAKSGVSSEIQTVELPLEKSGTDLVIDAAWRGSDNHALRIQILKNEISIYEVTLWGNQTVQDVVTIPQQKTL